MPKRYIWADRKDSPLGLYKAHIEKQTLNWKITVQTSKQDDSDMD